jgi:CCR4-NOT transcription complex subunit 6
MKEYRTNAPKKLKDIKDIKDEFDYTTNITNKYIKNKLKRSASFWTLNKRPKIKDNLLDNVGFSYKLDQIGNDDLIFNNDKLITSIKIDSFENDSKKNSIISIENGTSYFINSPTNRKKSSSVDKKSSRRKRNQNRSKVDDLTSLSNINSFDLNCNKMSYSKSNNKLNTSNIGKKGKNNSSQNLKKAGSPTKSKNNIKNVSQFINKPNEIRRNNQHNLTTTINKSPQRIRKLNNSSKNQNSISSFNIKNCDTLSLASNSRLETRSCMRGSSMPTKKSNLHLPNKSIIKNQDKLINELQKLFGEKIQLSSELYENMTDLDKKNCINFLLESIKELNNINKINKSKTDGYKQINEVKDQQIKSLKNEIKDLKKEIMNLNKIIKKDMQLNKKLTQNVDNLKNQLEKEKAKNKTLQSRNRSTSKLNSSFINNKSRDGNSKKKIRQKSQDIMKKASHFVNRKKVNEEDKNKILNNNMNANANNVNNISWKNREEKEDINQNSKILNGIIEIENQNEIKNDNNFNINSDLIMQNLQNNNENKTDNIY